MDISAYKDESVIIDKAITSFKWLIENVEKPLNAIRKDLKSKVKNAFFTALILELKYKLMLLIDRIIFKTKLNIVLSKSR